jgi:hypothetical protein
MGEVDDNAVVTDAGAGRKGPAGSREHCDPGTGWRGRDEGESSGELDGPPSERRDVPVLERLSQQFDGIAANSVSSSRNSTPWCPGVRTCPWVRTSTLA